MNINIKSILIKDKIIINSYIINSQFMKAFEKKILVFQLCLNSEQKMSWSKL